MAVDLSSFRNADPGTVVASASQASELLKFLERKHSVYSANEATWKEINDVVYDGVKNNKSAYIPKGHEEQADYNRRLSFARFKGELAPTLHRLVGAVFKEPPGRPEAQVSKWGDFIASVDGCHTHIDSYLEDRLFDAMSFGADFVLVDRPPTDGDTMGSPAREKTSHGFMESEEVFTPGPEDVQLIHYKRTQVWDWNTDRCGELHWVKLQESVTTETVPGMPVESDVFRIYDRMSWVSFEVTKNEKGKARVKFTGFADHNLGIVPLAILWKHRDTPMDFPSEVQYAYHHDIHGFMADSDLQYDQWLHAHPMINDCRANPENKVQVGPGAVNECDPSRSESVSWEDFPTGSLDALRESKRDAVDGMRRLTGIDPMSGTNDPTAMSASGTSKKVSFSISEERTLRRWSRSLTVFETRIFEIAERWAAPGDSMPSPRERLNENIPSYPQQFSSESTDDLIDQWASTRSQINSETYDKEMQVKIVTAALGDISKETREDILEEIRENPIVGGAQQALTMFEEDDGDPDDASDAIDETEKELLPEDLSG